MSEQLKVELSGDASKLKSALSEAQKALQGFENDAKSFQDALEKNAIKSSLLGREIKALSESFKSGKISSATYEKSLAKLEKQEQDLTNQGKSLRSSLKDTQSKMRVLSGNSGLGGVQKATANATPTLLEFNRVIQDAPFGIQGVANNITQLTTNFGYLKQSTGSTKGALQALVAGFTGPAGILFAVSAVTSLLVSYGDKLQFAASQSNKLAKASKEFVSDAYSEIEALKILVSIASDVGNSYKVRKGALDEINDKYGEYLGNLDLESVKTDKVRQSIDKLSQSLILKAKIEGLSALITEKTSESAEDLIRLELEKEAAIRKSQSALSDFINGNKLLKTVLSDQKGFNARFLALKKLAKQQTDLGELARRGLGIVNIPLDEYKDLSSEIKTIQENADDALAPLLKLQESFKKNVFEITPIITEPVIKDVGSGGGFSTPLVSKLNLEIATEGFDISEVIGEGIDNAVERVDIGAVKLKIALENLNAAASDIISNGISNTFAGLGQSIGESFATGGNIIESVGSSLLSSIGGILVELGKQAIAVGVGLLGIKAALKTLNPAAAIAAGVALVAIGGAFSSAASNAGSSIGGGGNTGSSSSIGGSTRTSGFSGSGGGFDGGRVVFEISGQKLVGVLDRTRNRNLAIGG